MAGVAPILLFAYNRPLHLQQTLTFLAANDLAAASPLVIVCDGPKTEDAVVLVREVRAVAKATTGFASLEVIERDRNWGLAPNIIDGVTLMTERYGEVIVVEDDLVTSPHFLRFMNDGLRLYADNPAVASIHGWCFPHEVKAPPPTFFLRGADCWGWATWRRAWASFEPDAQTLLDRLAESGLEQRFNCDGNYDYVGMLRNQRDGKVSSWAIRWHAATFLADMYTLYPSRSLVKNIGLDASGTHCGTTDIYGDGLAADPVPVKPIRVVEHSAMRRAVNAFYGRASGRAQAVGRGVGGRLLTTLTASLRSLIGPRHRTGG